MSASSPNASTAAAIARFAESWMEAAALRGGARGSEESLRSVRRFVSFLLKGGEGSNKANDSEEYNLVQQRIKSSKTIEEAKQHIEDYATQRGLSEDQIQKALDGEDKTKVIAVIEQVSAMPGQGVTSMFNFGQSFGVLKGIFSAMQIPMDFVSPVKWKKFFNLINTNKDASRTKAIEIYPYFSSKLSKKKDANKADAILISSFYYQNAKY